MKNTFFGNTPLASYGPGIQDLAKLGDFLEPEFAAVCYKLMTVIDKPHLNGIVT
jgi:hypothetical protein